MSLAADVAQVSVGDSKTQRQNRALNKQLTDAQAELERLRGLVGLVERIEQSRLEPPKWARSSHRKIGKKGIVTLQLSDTHFDEVVRPEQVEYINAYDRHIAELRLRRWVEKAIVLARDYVAGVELEGVFVLATGDIFSGDIHEELKETNADTLYGSVVHWIEQLSAAIHLLADEFGRVHIGAVVGNHGRDTKKPRYKLRAQSNIEWLLWKMIAREFAQDTRVTFQIGDGMDLTVRIYDTNYLITHGDEFKGGSGIQGARAPLALGQHRTTVRQMATDHPLDYMVVGHFHQYQPPSQGLVMGGSLKGYDEFAYGKRFRPEPAQQAFWITTPERGPTIAAPIAVQDRKSEGW
ncbi:MAG: hypothetical protein EPN91_00740 [Salinibacterium sp.]|nr:MAG: hypothetical protein EPN91_00740 [Salinibacterium sp.]